MEYVRDAMGRCRGIIEQGEAPPPTGLFPDPHQLREEIIARTGLQVEARTFRPHISLREQTCSSYAVAADLPACEVYGVLDFDKREEIARALNERFFDESENLSFKLHKVCIFACSRRVLMTRQVAVVESPVPGYDGIGEAEG